MSAEAKRSPENREALWRNVGLAAAFAVPFLVYLYTLAPSLTFEDPMEFTLGAATLGVDHPSGYPLMTLVGHLFTYLPAGEPAWRVNLSSALLAAAASAFVFLLTWELLAPVAADRRRLAAGAWAAAGLFAFSYSFWPQAVIPEVYSLNAALFGATLWCGARCNARRDVRWYYAAAFAAALAAANHPLSLAATAPLLAYLWFKLKSETNGAALLTTAAALVLLGLSFYLYLALRASREPALNWGIPADLPRFLDHVRRREYGTIYWPRYRYLAFHLSELGRLLLRQFGPGVGALAAVGLVWLLKLRTPFAGALAVLAAITGPAAMLPLVGLLTPFQVFEIEVWYLSFFLVCAPLAAGAALLLVNKIRAKRLAALAAAALTLLPAYPASRWLARANLRNDYFSSETGGNRLRTLPRDAVLAYPFHGRQGLFAQSYLRLVEGRRPDVLSLDPRNVVRNELLVARRPLDFIREEDAAERWWRDLRRDLLSTMIDRPFFYNLPDPDAASWDATSEPYGLVYRVRRRGSEKELPGPPWKRYAYGGLSAVGKSLAAPRVPYAPTTYRVWTSYYVLAAEYCFLKGRDATALRDLAVAERAVGADPHIPSLLASTYTEHGYPEKALPLHLESLRHMERYRYDTDMSRRHYAGTLNETAHTYLKLGDAEAARRYYEESLRVYPDQPEMAGHISPEELAAAAAYYRARRR